MNIVDIVDITLPGSGVDTLPDTPAIPHPHRARLGPRNTRSPLVRPGALGPWKKPLKADISAIPLFIHIRRDKARTPSGCCCKAPEGNPFNPALEP